MFEEAADVALKADHRPLVGSAQYRLGRVLFGAGEYEASAEAYGQAANFYDAPDDGTERAVALWGRADALRVLGDFAGALAAATESRAFAETEESFQLAGDACFQQARALYFLDRDHEALLACRDARDHLRGLGLTSDVAMIDDFALTICMYLGDLDQAMDLATSCHILAKTSSTPDDDAYAMRRLAEVHMQRGDAEEALQLLDQARSRYREADRTIGVARCDQMRGELLTTTGQLDEALEVFTEARVLFDATGDDRSALRCDMDRAILLHLLGQYEAAARANRAIIDSCSDDDHDVSVRSWRRWAIVRLADNLLAAKASADALDVTDTWPRETADEDGVEPAYLALTALRARAYRELGRDEEALTAAEEVLQATTMANLPAMPATCSGSAPRPMPRREVPRGNTT